MMKTVLYGTMMLAALVVASAPFAAAECVEGAGSMACASDYSNDAASYYVVEAYAVDGSMVYVTLFEGKNWFGSGMLSADAFADSPTLGAGTWIGVYGTDRVPTDGHYEDHQVYVDAWTYDGTYEYAYVVTKDTNGDGVADDASYGTSTGLLP